MNTSVNHFISVLLCSFSQIMLQRSAAAGFLFVVGIGINSPIMLIGAIIAVISGLVTAKLLKFDNNAIFSGLYGYNAVLVGIALSSLLPANLFLFILVVFAAALSTAIMHFMSKKMAVLPVFTTPFIISSWLLMLVIDVFSIDTLAATFTTNAQGNFYVVMRGVGQIMLQDYWLSGAIFITGLCLSSYKVAVWAVIGSVGGMLTAQAFSFPTQLVLMGLYGFNASLTAIALAERYSTLAVKKQWPILLGIVVSVVLTRSFDYLAIPALTAPFVLASWLVIVIGKTADNKAPKYQKPEIS